jgi:chemotaxis protein MotB
MSGGGEKTKVIVKKKKGHGHGHHGGAWKVAYADFVTAMMALFMVLWLLTQADLATRQAIAQYFRNPGILATGSGVTSKADTDSVINSVTPELGTEARRSEQQLLEREAKDVQEAIEKMAESDPSLKAVADQVNVKITEDGLVIDLADAEGGLMFDESSSEMNETLTRVLEKLAPVLAQVPNNVEISGHTDSKPFPAGSKKTNWDLSYERANEAREVMTRSGLRPKQLTKVEAMADSEPINRENPDDPRNRRLSILVKRRGAAPQPGDDKAPGKGGEAPAGGEGGSGGGEAPAGGGGGGGHGGGH